MASTDSRRIIRAAPYRLFGVINAVSTFRPITGGLTSTGATVDIDAAGFNAAVNTGSVIEIGTTGFFYIDLVAAEMTGDHITAQITATNSGAMYFQALLTPEACLDSGVAQSGTSTTITLRSGASATAGLFVPAVIEIVRGTGAGQIRGIVAYNSSQQVTVDRAWTVNPDSTSIYTIKPLPHGTYDSAGLVQSNAVQINSNATAAANMAHAWGGGTLYDTMTGSPSTTQFAGGGTATLNSSIDNFYQNCLVIFLTGACAHLARRVNAYTAASKLFTMDAALPTAPSAADQYQLISYQS